MLSFLQHKKYDNFDNSTNEIKAHHDAKWSYIPDHPYKIIIIGGPESGKINRLWNLINNKQDIDKIHLYANDTYDAKYKYLISKQGKVDLNLYEDLIGFIEYTNDMQNFYKNTEECNLREKKCKKKSF